MNGQRLEKAGFVKVTARSSKFLSINREGGGDRKMSRPPATMSRRALYAMLILDVILEAIRIIDCFKSIWIF